MRSSPSKSSSPAPTSLGEPKRRDALAKLLAKWGFRMNHLELLDRALTHTSFANETRNKGMESNEKLEYLGDSVLGLVVSDFIYRRFPEMNEGDLSKVKGHVVSEAVLSKKSREYGIGNVLLLGKGEEASGGKNRASILADAFEAVIGAMYMDGDLARVSSFILKALEPEIRGSRSDKIVKDYKSALQEAVQRRFKVAPRYQVVQETGPQHHKTFDIQVSVQGEALGAGKGKSKKEAEQEAAREAYYKLKDRGDLVAN